MDILILVFVFWPQIALLKMEEAVMRTPAED
jgi:hypothetical protein